MKVRLKEDFFDIEHETDADKTALVVHCRRCGSLYSFGADTPLAKDVRGYLNSSSSEPVSACKYETCWRCRKSSPPPCRFEFLGEFPETSDVELSKRVPCNN